MTRKIQVKRGNKAKLPTLDVGELAFTTDTNEFYVGSVHGNIKYSRENFVNVRDFGAVGDGVTDDSVAIQAALDTGRTVYIPDGHYLCNVKYGATSEILGESQNNTILESYTSDGYPIMITKVSWQQSKITNLCFKGTGTAGLKGGLTFGHATYKSYDEYHGRVTLERVLFDELNICVYKPYGHIGNIFQFCSFETCNYHYYVEEDSTGVQIDVMHGGCDTFYRNHFKLSEKACVFMDSALAGTGQTIFRDNLFEGNDGFVLFVENYNSTAWSPGIIWENNWGEQNMREATVNINGIDYSTKYARIKNVASMNINSCNLSEMELINSTVVTNNCSTGDDYASIIRDNDSQMIVDNAIFYKNTDTTFYTQRIVDGQAEAVGTSSRFRTKPRSIITTGYLDNVVISETFHNKDSWSFPGSVATKYAKIVEDGVLFDASAEITMTVGGGLNLYGITDVPANKYVVWTLDAKLVSGTSATIHLTNSNTIASNIVVSGSEWMSLAGFTHTGASSKNISLYLPEPTSDYTLRLSAYQILIFTDKQEAITYLDKGLFQTSASIPRRRYGTGKPVTGTWRVGDVIYNSAPTVGQPLGWFCYSEGTPGFWQEFGGTASALSNSTATDVAGIVANFNSLLTVMRTAGLLDT